MVTTQYPGTTRGFNSIIQGGAPDWEYYTETFLVSTGGSIYPGNIVSTAGETAGECDPAASGDGLISAQYVVLKRVGIGDKEQDIDTQITAGQKVLCLRKSQDDGLGYGRFIVAVTVSDGTSQEVGEPMVLDATGWLKKFAYASSTDVTDTMGDCLTRCAEATADFSSANQIQLVYW